MSADVEGTGQGATCSVFKRLSTPLNYPPVSIVHIGHLAGTVQSAGGRVDDEGARLVVVADTDDVRVGVIVVAPGRLAADMHLRHIAVNVVHTLVRTQITRSHLQPTTT